MRQRTVTRVGTDRAALHLHPQSNLHLQDHLAWTGRRQMRTIPLDLEEWCCPDANGIFQLAAEHAVTFIDARGQALDLNDWTNYFASVRNERSDYVSSSGRHRDTQGLRSTGIALPPWFTDVLHSDADRQVLAATGKAAMQEHANATGFPSLGAAVVLQPDRLSCHVFYGTVARNPDDRVNRRIVSTAPGVDRNNNPVLLGGAALAAAQLQNAGMLSMDQIDWVDRRSIDQTARGRLPVDYVMAEACYKRLTSELERDGRGGLLRAAKEAYATRVAVAVEQATNPEWRVLALEDEIAALHARAVEIGAIRPPTKADLLGRVATAAAVAQPEVEHEELGQARPDLVSKEQFLKRLGSASPSLKAHDKPDVD